jgi:hypothetical protein
MGTRFKQWLRDVSARLVSQAVVTLIFATVPIIFSLWDWRGIIVRDHVRQMQLDSLLSVHLQDYGETKRRVELIEWQRRVDSVHIETRFDGLERSIGTIRREAVSNHTNNNNKGLKP